LVFLALTVGSCRQKEEVKTFDDIYALSETDDATFFLDSVTSQQTGYLQLIEKKDSLILSFLNKYDNSILFYDCMSKDFISKIIFHRDGPMNVGNIQSYCYIDEDSILLYDINTLTLYMANSDAGIIKKSKIDIFKYSTESFICPEPLPQTTAPLFKIDRLVLLMGYRFGGYDNETNIRRASTAVYSLDSDSLYFINEYPDMYKKGNWGIGTAFREVSNTYTPDRKMVLSFSADPDITVREIYENTEETFYAGSKHHTKIQSLKKSVEQTTVDDEVRFYMENTVYHEIIYDKYNKLYYRFAHLPVYDGYSTRDFIHKKPISVIILDENFNKVGETLLPANKYYSRQCFVSPEGLHIQVLSDDDDWLKFKVFRIYRNKDKSNIAENILNNLMEIDKFNQRNYTHAVIIPGSGCTGCISEAESFFKENKNENIFFIFTDIFSIKELRLKLKDLDMDNVFIDEKSLFYIEDEEKNKYPVIVNLMDKNNIKYKIFEPGENMNIQ
jgi:hypothetical protein